MQKFVINKNQQANGDHEVHNTSTGCSYMPNVKNQIDLGYHVSCKEAVIEAKKRWTGHRINGCYYCSIACHTS
ncbi:hypothetical protein MLC35_11350 [Sulfurimonas sp. NW7]|uniref:hypothetical protein n=1 Tax=Sulfurimonas sp. NW7 TaxID=2922727 RepID=UPI003DA7C951